VLIPVTCPGCGKVRQINESFAGKLVRCPKCSEFVEVPQPDPDAGPPGGGFPPDAAEEVVKPRRRRAASRLDDDEGGDDFHMARDSGRWRVVRFGLLALRAADVLLLLALVGLVAGVLRVMALEAAAVGAGGEEARTAGLILLGALACAGVAVAVQFTGLVLCCLVPRDAGARGRVLLALLLYVLALALPPVGVAVSAVFATNEEVASLAPAAVSWAAMLGAVLWLGSHLLAALFLADVAFYFGRKRVASSAFLYALVLFVGVVTAVTANYLAANLDPRGITLDQPFAPRLGGPTGKNFVTPVLLVHIVSVVLLGAMFVWHLLLLGSVRRIIRKELQAAVSPKGGQP
jgi:hypothetical protein